ncbi:hypothetical protein [Azospira restricta]|uniref:hypothetical protein n=1 Tax=Azospira restricta TaxID=404405 RepID=UPI00193AEA11|nr:hypothetical protein [Azospira restricta]
MSSTRKLSNPEDPALPVWRSDAGAAVSCTEKVKVLNENFRELEQMLRDAIEDGVLMGCSEAQLRAEFHALVEAVRIDVRP